MISPLRFLIVCLIALQLPAQTAPAATPLLTKAEALARQGQLKPAEVVAREYLIQHADSGDGHFLLGYILFLQSRAKESLAEYTEGAKYRAPSATDLKVVGSDYVVLGDFADADKWFTKVIEWSPQDVQAWYDLGRTKYNENRFQEAIAAFKQVLVLDSANVKAEDNLGLSCQAEGRNEEAIAAYKRAIALQRDISAKNPGPYLNLGSLLSDLDQPAEALAFLKTARQILDTDFRVHRELGKTYQRLSDLANARSEIERAVELAPANAPLHFMLAQIYRKLGLSAKARAETERYSALK